MKENSEPLYIYGRQPVIEALRSGHAVYKLWMAAGLSGSGVGPIKKLAEGRGVHVQTVHKKQLQKFVGAVVHQGVAASVPPPQFLADAEVDALLNAKKNPLILVLDQIQDPHNLGAIIRTAEISGTDLIAFAEKGTAKLNATVVKTSAGAVFYQKFYQASHILSILDKLNERGIQTLALAPGAETLMYDAPLKQGVALVVGSEGRGLRKNVERQCSGRIAIPQFGRVNSLNASVATAIVLFEALRQRKRQD